MPRTLFRAANIEDVTVVSEPEFNEFFEAVVLTGTANATELTQSFANYFSGQGLIQGAGNVTVITGSNSVIVSGTGGSTAGTLDQDFTAGQNLSAGDVVALNGAGNVIPAIATSADTIEVIGCATSAALTGQTAAVRHQGNLGGFSGLTAGEPLFLSATISGGVTETPPSTSGTYILQVGQVISSTEIYVNVDSASTLKNTSEETATLQSAYNSGNGIITIEAGKPVVVSGIEGDGNVDFKVVGSGTFTEGLQIGTGSVSIDGDTITGEHAIFNEVTISGVQAATVDDVSDRALDSDVVHLAGNETITGNKTFTSDVFFSGAGNHLAIGTTTPNNASLYIAPEAGQEWFRAGTGGDAGVWVIYENVAPHMKLSDFDDPPGIILQQIGGGSESAPDHKVELAMPGQLTSGLSVFIDGANKFEIKSDGTVDVSGTLKTLATTSTANLWLKKSTSSTYWTIDAGRTGFYDNWLLFKNENEGSNYSFAISNNGAFRGKDGAAGAPTYTFDNASNYGMSYDSGANEGLVLSTEGHARLRIEDDGTLSVAGTSNYETLVTADDDIPNKKYVDDAAGGVFGSEFQQASSEGESSTTSETYQQKLRLTTTSLPSGTYRVGWSFEAWSTNKDKSFEVRAQLDDTTTLGEINDEMSADNMKLSFSNFKYETLSGVHNIDIDYRTAESNTAHIRRARLEIWRVS